MAYFGGGGGGGGVGWGVLNNQESLMEVPIPNESSLNLVGLLQNCGNSGQIDTILAPLYKDYSLYKP